VKQGRIERKRSRSVGVSWSSDVPAMSLKEHDVCRINEIPIVPPQIPDSLNRIRSRIRNREGRESTVSFIASILSGILRDEDLELFVTEQNQSERPTYNYDVSRFGRE
jgi:hypothetical protein